jgi:hypothetical protein
MLDETCDSMGTTARGVENEPALTLPQPVFEGVKVQAEPQQQIAILKRGLFDEFRSIGHC